MSVPEVHALSVLVVISRPDVGGLLSGLLAVAGPHVASVEVVDTPDRAAERLAVGSFDVALVEAVDGDLAGVARLGRDLDHGRRVPLVAVHDGAIDSVGIDAVSAGADEVVALNGLDAGTLIRVLRTTVARHRRAHQVDADRDLDMVTGLGSRRWVLDRLDTALATLHEGTSDREVAVLLVDLDRFKLVNDTFGHGVGDELLRAVAERLRHVVRSDDPLARLGGDEFCIVMNGHHVRRLAPLVGRRVIGALEAPFRVAGHSFPVHASVGIAVHSHGDSRGDLISHADAALYAAKSRGRRRVEVFDQLMRAQNTRHRRLASRLSEAIAHDRLRLRDEVLVDLEAGRAVGRYVSPRWDDGGGSSDLDLIDVARRSGQAPDLGRWTVGAAFRLPSDAGPAVHQLLVSLPSGMVVQPTFGSELLRLAEARDVDPTSVVVLVPEDDFDELELVSPVIDTLASEGFGIGIDDFGTGRSSLILFGSDLVDYVRLSGHLTTDLGADASKARYLGGLADIADAVGQHLIASHAASLADLRLLRDLGCHLAVVDRTQLDLPPDWQMEPRLDLRRVDSTHPAVSQSRA